MQTFGVLAVLGAFVGFLRAILYYDQEGFRLATAKGVLIALTWPLILLYAPIWAVRVVCADARERRHAQLEREAAEAKRFLAEEGERQCD